VAAFRLIFSGKLSTNFKKSTRAVNYYEYGNLTLMLLVALFEPMIIHKRYILGIFFFFLSSFYFLYTKDFEEEEEEKEQIINRFNHNL
jgi:hypothetical protein